MVLFIPLWPLPEADLAAPVSAYWLRPFDTVVYCAAAKSNDLAGYERAYLQGGQGLVRALQTHQQKPARLLFTSSTAVYAIQDGSMVDEASPTLPTDFRGATMLQAEQTFLTSGWPAGR
jgi:nucleoside-diphosphate-sugar epimerase